MPHNKNALLRYRTIDRCLRNHRRRWTLDDLVEACSDALYEYEGKYDNVSRRTVQLDLQMMRSSRLYEAPIDVYDRKYYRYSDPEYSIAARPLSDREIELLRRTIDLLRQYDEFDGYGEMAEVASRLRDHAALASRRPIVEYERNPNLKGLKWLNPLYDAIASRQTVDIAYQSFTSRRTSHFTLYPYLLKEYRNRWFLFGSRVGDMQLFNLALDRIKSFEVRNDLAWVENPEFGEGYFDDVVGVTKHSGLKRALIRLRATRLQSCYISTKPLHWSQREVERDRLTGEVTFELDVVVNHELLAQLLSFGDGIRVVSPPEVVAAMGDICRRCAAFYAPPATSTP